MDNIVERVCLVGLEMFPKYLDNIKGYVILIK
jgi:hypothetical protein